MGPSHLKQRGATTQIHLLSLTIYSDSELCARIRLASRVYGQVHKMYVCTETCTYKEPKREGGVQV
jgi:hypothetical protein